MKKTLLSLLILISAISANGQTIAPDFTANDCNGIPHNLYTELNSGKVIVLNWVMPCAACIAPSVAAYNVVQGYASPNVLYYLIDDFGNTSCSSLSNWADNNNIGSNRTTFSTSAIVENNYGGTGMPHVMVIGPDHVIYYNGFNGTAGNITAIQNAINTALTATGIGDAGSFQDQLSITYNQDAATVSYSIRELSTITLDVYDETGKSVASKELGSMQAGRHQAVIDLKGIAGGIYFVRLTTGSSTKSIKFSIAQ